jgi:hypothetical protein
MVLKEFALSLSRIAFVLVAAVALVAVGLRGVDLSAHAGNSQPPPLPAQAPSDVAIGNLRLLDEPDGDTPMDRFLPGTRVIYAVFDYAGADGHEIGLSVTGRGALNVFDHTGRYEGEGTESLAIDGTRITQALASELDESAQAARDDTRRAASQPFGVQEYLLAAHGSLLRVGYALDLLEGAELGTTGPTLLADVRAETDASRELVHEAIRVPAAEMERKRELARDADYALVQNANLAGQLTRMVDGLSGLPLPETGPDWRFAYAVQLQVRGLPVGVQEFLVSESEPIYLPRCVKE